MPGWDLVSVYSRWPLSRPMVWSCYTNARYRSTFNASPDINSHVARHPPVGERVRTRCAADGMTGVFLLSLSHFQACEHFKVLRLESQWGRDYCVDRRSWVWHILINYTLTIPHPSKCQHQSVNNHYVCRQLQMCNIVIGQRGDNSETLYFQTDTSFNM